MTMWTKFWHFLTIYPLWWTNVDISSTMYLSTWTNDPVTPSPSVPPALPDQHLTKWAETSTFNLVLLIKIIQKVLHLVTFFNGAKIDENDWWFHLNMAKFGYFSYLVHVDNCLTIYVPPWTKVDFWLTIHVPHLVHVVIEWPLSTLNNCEQVSQVS